MRVLKKLHHKWIITLLLFVYICIQSYCLTKLTINYDEGLFGAYGVTILKLQGDKDIIKFDSKLPITALNMLPRAIQQLLHPGLTKESDHSDLMMGRYVSLMVTILLSLIIYRWSSLLYGNNAGLFSFIIFLLCPNFLAHGIFVSSDIYACLFMSASFYFLWNFFKSGLTKDFFFAGLFVALAQISKFSMVHLIIIFPLLLLTGYFSRRVIFPFQKFNARKVTGLCFLFMATNWLVICAAHLFYGMYIPLNEYQFLSSTFQNIQAGLHGIGSWLPVPLPSSYIKSLDFVIYLDHLGGGMPGNTINPPYILGSHSVNGFWYYYFVALFYKLPLPLLLLIGLTAIMYFIKRKQGSFLQNEMFLIIPSVYFLVDLDFFYSTQIGIRHIIIILPLLYIFTGFFFQQMLEGNGRYLCYALVFYEFISVGLYFPHFLPYTNEFITDKKMAYKKIADTNLCYGEGGNFLKQYLQQHPEAHYLPQEISSGKIVMEVNELVDLNMTTAGKYKWLSLLTPSNHIDSQYLIFEVTPSMADSLRKVHF